MISKKDIIGSELMKEIISQKVDSLWKMLMLKELGRLPNIDDEGATGKFDNKGAIFIPGDIILEDSDGNSITKKYHGTIISAEKFRNKIKSAMQFDNATLFYQDAIATGVNLDNSFFIKTAGEILTYKNAAVKRKRKLSKHIPNKITADDITKSLTPTYINPPYGSRTKLSSSVSLALVEPWMYQIKYESAFSIKGEQRNSFWNNYQKSQMPVLNESGDLLAQPYVVVCHATRYIERIYTGLIKILGFGKFGEFATFTLEDATHELLTKTPREEFTKDDFFAEYKDNKIIGVLRVYPKTTPGKRSKNVNTYIVSPEKDLNLNLNELTNAAKENYSILD